MEIAIVVLVGGVFYVLTWMTFSLLFVHKVRVQNDDDAAKDAFVEVLNCAKRTLLVHDDGGSSSALYRDDGIVKQVRARLEGNGRLRIRMLFDCRDDGNKLAAMQAEEAYQCRERLDIRYLSPEHRPPSEFHCKIADGGRSGCLSVHEQGAKKRPLAKFDCSKSWLGRQLVFKRLIDDFNRQFQTATQ